MPATANPPPAYPPALFYVVAPPYSRPSAGIRCLHLLCHHLNQSGREAFLLPEAPTARHARTMRVGPELTTPVLDHATARAHARQGRVPVVVMPETVSGNPYGAPCVLRLAMHYPGFLGGDATYAAAELRFGFSRGLAEAVGAPDNVLFIPSIDLSTFKPPDDAQPRRGACFYADKFRKVHGGVPSGITDGAVEIVRYEPTEQSPAEIAALFRTSEVFYAYENTALAIEAVLCGCPAVFLPNPWLTSIISDAELGREGYAWGAEPAEVAFARDTVGQGARNYHAIVERFPADLDSFVAKAMRHATRFAPGLKVWPHRPETPPWIETYALDLSRRSSFALAKRIAELASTLKLRRLSDVLWVDLHERQSRRASEGLPALGTGAKATDRPESGRGFLAEPASAQGSASLSTVERSGLGAI